MTYTNETGADTMVYLVIDSYSTGGCGEYSFVFTPTGGAVANEIKSFGEVKAMYR